MRKVSGLIAVYFITLTVCMTPAQAFINTAQGGYHGEYDVNAHHEVNLTHKDSAKSQEIAKQIYQHLRSIGITETGAAGILGNMFCESGWDPTVTQSHVDWNSARYGGTGLGLVQWTYWSRQDLLFNEAHNMGTQWTDLGVQLVVLEKEIRSYNLEFLYDESVDIYTASTNFCNQYEKPGAANITARYEASQRAYEFCTGLSAQEFRGSYTNSAGVATSIKGIISEWEIAGMPMPMNLGENAKSIVLPSRSYLSPLEDYSLQLVKDSIEVRDGWGFILFVRTLIAFIGLIILVYAVLLYFVALLDRVNVFFDLSLVTVITFGRLKLVEDKSIENHSQGRVSFQKVFWLSVICVLISIILISGSMYQWAYLLYSYIIS